MRNPGGISEQLVVEPLTTENWDQFEQLFGNKGACGNCWCMAYRLKKQDFESGKLDQGNRQAIKKVVSEKKPAGILGFYQGKAIAWCAFAPREDFLRLDYSRVHKRIDQEPVWSIPCFFIEKKFRRQGVSLALLKAVINYAREQKINSIEAYPLILKKEKLPDPFAWAGVYQVFEKAGFQIVDHTSTNRPMVRYRL